MTSPVRGRTRLELLPRATRTATVSGPAIEVPDTAREMRIHLATFSAATGTSPTLDVTIQEALDDAGTLWYGFRSFPQFTTAIGVAVLEFLVPYGKLIRAQATIGGTTPSFDFEVVALTWNQEL